MVAPLDVEGLRIRHERGEALAGAGIGAANTSAEPAMSSLVPTPISVGAVIAATSSSEISAREVSMQAASASRSLLVWSAKARNIFPRGCSTVAGSSAVSAAAIGSQSPTPSIMP